MRTLSPKAAYALIGDALLLGSGLSVVRMGDGEARLLEAPDGEQFDFFSERHPGWNGYMGIDGLEIEKIKAAILEAGNTCTYFAPSVSGVHIPEYKLHHFFARRDVYFDNFFVNDWTPKMIKDLLTARGGAFIIHKDYARLIQQFSRTYDISVSSFEGFPKHDWRDTPQAIVAASQSSKSLVLFSAGPAGKVIAPKIAVAGKVVLDIGNTLPGWSIGDPRAPVMRSVLP